MDGLLEDVDLERYRVEARETMRIQYENENGEINPIPVGTDVGIDVPELDTLSNILQAFHDVLGDIEWTDEDKVKKQVAELPNIVKQDEACQNAMVQQSTMTDAVEPEDKKSLLRAMISSIEICNTPNGKRAEGHLIKTIHVTFPVTCDGESGVPFVSSTGGKGEGNSRNGPSCPA